jgi:hypothetical protein
MVFQDHYNKEIMKKTHSATEPEVKGKTQPIRRKEEVPASNDEHIDQDFPGYPHNPGKETNINPKNRKDKMAANADKNSSDQDTKDTSDQDNGSGGAFEATENPRE